MSGNFDIAGAWEPCFKRFFTKLSYLLFTKEQADDMFKRHVMINFK